MKEKSVVFAAIMHRTSRNLFQSQKGEKTGELASAYEVSEEISCKTTNTHMTTAVMGSREVRLKK